MSPSPSLFPPKSGTEWRNPLRDTERDKSLTLSVERSAPCRTVSDHKQIKTALILFTIHFSWHWSGSWGLNVCGVALNLRFLWSIALCKLWLRESRDSASTTSAGWGLSKRHRHRGGSVNEHKQQPTGDDWSCQRSLGAVDRSVCWADEETAQMRSRALRRKRSKHNVHNKRTTRTRRRGKEKVLSNTEAKSS